MSGGFLGCCFLKENNLSLILLLIFIWSICIHFSRPKDPKVAYIKTRKKQTASACRLTCLKQVTQKEEEIKKEEEKQANTGTNS